MRDGTRIAGGHRARFIGVAAAASVMAALGVTSSSHALGAETVPPAADQEEIPADEPDAIKSILDTFEGAVKKEHGAGARPAWRDAHAKAHGCVKADFSVKADIPAELRSGVFAAPRSFTAWIRFSNGHGKPQDDRTRDGRGMAIKLTGVDGPKLLAEEAEAKTQDFVMINSPAFFIRNAGDYVSFTRASKYHVPFAFFLTHWHELRAARAIVEETVDEVFEERYFSMTPYLLGQRYIKFSARPVDCGTGAALVPAVALPPAGPDYLRDRMIAWMNSRDACFIFAVQPQTDPATMPVEDPTIVWDEIKAPFIDVATIRIPKQRFDSEAQQTFCENLSYTPWHALAEHRPVGGINRIRKVVYEGISVLRHKLNKTPRV
ncbi:MAG: catalase, partial [Acidobacteria bacterium]